MNNDEQKNEKFGRSRSFVMIQPFIKETLQRCKVSRVAYG